MTPGDVPRLDVAGIGSMVVDRVHRTPRLLGDGKVLLRDVAPGSPVARHVGGVVLNHLGWAAALGLRAGVFGRQGDDAGGRFLRAAMARLGIARDLMIDGGATSMAEIFVDDEGARAIYMAPGVTSETTPEHVREHHAAMIRRAARLTTEVSQLPLAAAREALAIAREAGVPTVVDLDVPPRGAAALGSEAELEAVLRAADLLKPAKSAARELLPEAGEEPLALARAMRERFGNASVVVTDGAAGCAIVAEGFEGVVKGCAAEVIDTTGAGDAFLGGLLTALHHGLGWQDAGRLANASGAACSEQLGAFPEEPAAARARILALYEGPPLALGPLLGAAPSEEEAAATRVLDVTLEELAALRARVRFEPALRLLREVKAAGGRLHVTGIGKPEHVAHYAASLLASTGTPAAFLHGTEVVHGSAGQIERGDGVIAISNSGETRELLDAVAAVRARGARVLAVTGNPGSSLARAADAVLDAGVAREGGPLGLAPRASVAAEVLVLAALAAALQAESRFTRADYHHRHPAGPLAKKSQPNQ